MYVSWIMYAFWLGLTYDLNEDRCIDETNRFHFTMEMLFLPHFDIICDLLLNSCMATWNLSVKLIYAPQDRGGG